MKYVPEDIKVGDRFTVVIPEGSKRSYKNGDTGVVLSISSITVYSQMDGYPDGIEGQFFLFLSDIRKQEV
jgi:F420-0:gamma-glutamyl ligase